MLSRSKCLHRPYLKLQQHIHRNEYEVLEYYNHCCFCYQLNFADVHITLHIMVCSLVSCFLSGSEQRSMGFFFSFMILDTFWTYILFQKNSHWFLSLGFWKLFIFCLIIICNISLPTYECGVGYLISWWFDSLRL